MCLPPYLLRVQTYDTRTTVRFRHRDFVYHHRHQGPRDDVGSKFIADIPSKKKAYKGKLPFLLLSLLRVDIDFVEWLGRARQYFDEMMMKIDAECLTFTIRELQEMAKHRGEDQKTPDPGINDHRLAGSELAYLPYSLSVHCGYQADYYSRYVIDLDSEVFYIEDRSRPPLNRKIYFLLWSIPKPQCFTAPELFCFGPHIEPRNSRQAAQRLRLGRYDAPTKARSRPSSHEIVVARSFLMEPDLPSIVGLMVFDKLICFELQHWWTDVPFQDPSSFGFREVAFAILSIAADQYYMDRIDPDEVSNQYQQVSDCYLHFDRNEELPQVIPTLGSEFHVEGCYPGASPPDQTTYWFENVLVTLVSDHELTADPEAAIEKAMIFAHLFGRSNFFILAFSIRHAVLAAICRDKSTTIVRRTEPIQVYRKYDRRYGYRGIIRKCLDIDELLRRYHGFCSLQRFFQTAQARQRCLSRDMLPAEIYSQVFRRVDPATLKTCANLSPTLYAISQDSWLFSRNLNILDIEMANNEDRTSDYVGRCHVGKFTFLNHDANQTMVSTLCTSMPFGKPWFPVVGRWPRQCAIRQINLYTQLGIWRTRHSVPVGDEWSISPDQTRSASTPMATLVADGLLRKLA